MMKVKVNLRFLALDHGAQLCAVNYVSFVALHIRVPVCVCTRVCFHIFMYIMYSLLLIQMVFVCLSVPNELDVNK